MDKVAETGHPVHELIARRWSPRAFDARPVAPQDLRSVLEAARWAASSFNEQPWRFLVARRENAAEFERMLGCLVPANRSWAGNAGVLMLTAFRRAFERNGKPNRVALHDLGQAAAQLTLQAEHLGLRVHQMAGVDLEAVRGTYRIPEEFEPATAIALGHPGAVDLLPAELQAAERAPRSRRPQEQLAFEGAWDRPAVW